MFFEDMPNVKQRIIVTGLIVSYRFVNHGVSFYGMISTYFILKATTISFFFHFSHFTFLGRWHFFSYFPFCAFVT